MQEGLWTLNSINKPFVYWAVAVQSNTDFFHIQTRFVPLKAMVYVSKMNPHHFHNEILLVLFTPALYEPIQDQMHPGLEGKDRENRLWNRENLPTTLKKICTAKTVKAIFPGRSQLDKTPGMDNLWDQIPAAQCHLSCILWVPGEVRLVPRQWLQQRA